MKYLKKDLVEVIAKDTGFYKKDIEEVINSMLNNIPKMLNDKDDKLMLMNFGCFRYFNYKERCGRNPKTNESVLIPQHRTIKFTASEVIYNECDKETY